MNGEFAIDTNIAVYVFSEDQKSGEAFRLLELGPKVSVQVLNEFTNVSLRKRHVPWDEIEESLAVISSLVSSIRPIGLDVHRKAIRIAQRYKTSIYDSLLVAAALLDGCDIFYSEDMQHGQVFEGKLTVINPYRGKSLQ